MIYLGSQLVDSTVRIPFNTFDSSGGSVTVTDLAAGDVKIHKDGSTTERSSSAGITVSIDFDGITGNHFIAVDLSDDTDAGFYAADSVYNVRLEGITVDAQTLNIWIGRFRISAKPHVDDLQDLSSAQVTSAVPTAAEIRTEIDSNSTQLALILEDTGITIPGLIDAVPTVNEILAGLNAGTYDGKTFTELMTSLRGLGFGNIAVTDNGDGTWNVILYAADGTTAVATFTTNKTTGARTII